MISLQLLPLTVHPLTKTLTKLSDFIRLANRLSRPPLSMQVEGGSFSCSLTRSPLKLALQGCFPSRPPQGMPQSGSSPASKEAVSLPPLTEPPVAVPLFPISPKTRSGLCGTRLGSPLCCPAWAEEDASAVCLPPQKKLDGFVLLGTGKQQSGWQKRLLHRVAQCMGGGVYPVTTLQAQHLPVPEAFAS